LYSILRPGSINRLIVNNPTIYLNGLHLQTVHNNWSWLCQLCR